MKVKTCSYFEHDSDVIHKCTNEKNVTGRCGYGSDEIGKCPTAGAIVEKEIVTTEASERMKKVDVNPKVSDAHEDHEHIFGIKGRAILPFRLLEQAKAEFPYLDYPVKSKDAKQSNMDAVKDANNLIMFIDDEFFTVGKSQGTKIEALNNKGRVSEVYQLKGDKFVPTTFPVIDEKLPTWNEYVLTVE